MLFTALVTTKNPKATAINLNRTEHHSDRVALRRPLGLLVLLRGQLLSSGWVTASVQYAAREARPILRFPLGDAHANSRRQNGLLTSNWHEPQLPSVNDPGHRER